MQRVNIHKQHIVILIHQLYRLVYLTALVHLYQTAKTTHAVINMHNEIAHLQGVQLRHGHLLVTLDLAIYTVATITVKNLVIGIETHPQSVIHKTLVQGY